MSPSNMFLLNIFTLLVLGTGASPLNSPSHSNLFHSSNKDSPLIQCVDETNKPVDWVIFYKLPKVHSSTNPMVANGEAYMFVTSEDVKRFEEHKASINNKENVSNKERVKIEGSNEASGEIKKVYTDKFAGNVENKNIKHHVTKEEKAVRPLESKLTRKKSRDNHREKQKKNHHKKHHKVHIKPSLSKDVSNKGRGKAVYPNSLSNVHRFEGSDVNARSNKRILDVKEPSKPDLKAWFETLIVNALKRQLKDSAEVKDIEELLDSKAKKSKRDVGSMNGKQSKQMYFKNMIEKELERLNNKGSDRNIPSQVPWTIEDDIAQKYNLSHDLGDLNQDLNDLMERIHAIELLNNIGTSVNDLDRSLINLETKSMTENFNAGEENTKSVAQSENFFNGEDEITSFVNMEGKSGNADDLERFKYTMGDGSEDTLREDAIQDDIDLNHENSEAPADNMEIPEPRPVPQIDADRKYQLERSVSQADVKDSKNQPQTDDNSPEMILSRLLDTLSGEDVNPEQTPSRASQSQRNSIVGESETTTHKTIKKDLEVLYRSSEGSNKNLNREYLEGDTKNSKENSLEQKKELPQPSKVKTEGWKDSKVENVETSDDNDDNQRDAVNPSDSQKPSESVPLSLQWTLSKYSVRDPFSLPGRILSPYLFNASFSPLFAQNGVRILYNDQQANKTTFDMGHSKGLVLGNAVGGIWIVHSIPHFVDNSQNVYSYPHTGLLYGQNFLCMSLNASQLDSVGHNLGTNQAWTYSTFVAESLRPIFPTLSAVIDGKYVPQDNFFTSTIGTRFSHFVFRTFAKTREFSADLYRGISAFLDASLLVETWPNEAGRLRSDCKGERKVENVEAIGAGVVGWMSTHDHAKWAISFGNESRRSEEGNGAQSVGEATNGRFGTENDNDFKKVPIESYGSFDSVSDPIKEFASLDEVDTKSGEFVEFQTEKTDGQESFVDQGRFYGPYLKDSLGDSLGQVRFDGSRLEDSLGGYDPDCEGSVRKFVDQARFEDSYLEDILAGFGDQGRLEVTAGHYVCNGDINRGDRQFKRGGGSVCMDNLAVWSLYQGLISEVEPCPIEE